MGYVAVVVDLLVGGGLGSAMSLRSAITAIVIGNMVLMCIAATAAYLSFKSGRTFALLTQWAFGKIATIPLTLFIALIAVGWFSIQSSLFAHFISLQLGYGQAAESILAILLSLAMAITAYLGIDALRRLSMVAVPALAFVCVWTWLTVPATKESVESTASLALLPAISITIGAWIMGSTTTVGDLMRFARSAKVAIMGGAIGVSANLVLMILGAVAVQRYGTADLAEVLAASVGFIGGLIFFALNVWTTNDNAMYSAGLNISVATKARHRKAVLAAVTIAAIVAAFRPHRYEIMIQWLQFLGKIVPPIGAVVFVSIIVSARRDVSRLHVTSVISLIIGLIVAFGIKVGIEPLNGFFAAALSQVILLLVGSSLKPSTFA